MVETGRGPRPWRPAVLAIGIVSRIPLVANPLGLPLPRLRLLRLLRVINFNPLFSRRVLWVVQLAPSHVDVRTEHANPGVQWRAAHLFATIQFGVAQYYCLGPLECLRPGSVPLDQLPPQSLDDELVRRYHAPPCGK